VVDRDSGDGPCRDRTCDLGIKSTRARSRGVSRDLGRLAERFDADDDVFVYLNNDTEGCAPRDARVLAGLLAREGLQPAWVPAPKETPVGS
jgi:hypothetical protein